MFLLLFEYGEDTYTVGTFNSEQSILKFIEKIPGYKKTVVYDELIEHSIDCANLPDYLEVEYNGNILPLTKHSCFDIDSIIIYWYPITNFDIASKNTVIEGATKVDAYMVSNDELKTYINTREENYNIIKNALTEKGFDVSRDYQGSEDGEAIVYAKKSTDDWHFLTNMDGDFSSNPITNDELNDLLESMV